MNRADATSPQQGLAPRCVVFGEALVDAFPDAQVPGGAPFNVACHLAGLGLLPLFVSRVGHADSGAALLRRQAQRLGLDFSAVQVDATHGTGRVTVVECDAGHSFEIESDQAYDHVELAPALQQVAAYAGGSTPWLYFGTLALRSARSRATLQGLRAALRGPTFVDFNWRDAGPPWPLALEAVAGVSVLKVSAEELLAILAQLGLPDADTARPAQAGEQRGAILALMSALRLDHLLVTCGAEGASLWSADGRCMVHAPAAAVPVLRDTVGAGDAFSARALAGFMSGAPVEQMMRGATAFASALCGVRGALPDGVDFYRPWQAGRREQEVAQHVDA